jgi:P27 family predicted phage terminase small subunit
MGSRGPIPDPKSERSKAGRNTRARKTAAPEPASGLAPPAAVKARPIALRFWSAHAPTLAADGRLREDQVETFGILCHLYADCEQLGEQLAAEGWITATDKGQAASPVAKLLRDSRRDYVTLARDFGLTAASAARLPQDPNSGEEEADEEDALLAKLKLRGA